MAYIERHDSILELIKRLRRVTVQDLTERLKVSEVTIRKDLSTLEEMGVIIRTHGGAVLADDLNSEKTIKIRKEKNIGSKNILAKLAASLVNDNDTIYIDSGSTCSSFAKELKDKYLRIITNSIDVMTILGDSPGITLFSLGGTYRKEAGSFFGPIAVENIKNFHIQTCFLGATAFSIGGIFYSMSLIESQLKKHVMEVSKRKIVISDSTKFNKTALSVFARPGDIDILISDIDDDDAKAIRSSGIEVLNKIN